MIYWKYISGSLFFDSYAGQRFNWAHPKIIEGLFYGENGWLAYSPIMIYAIIGFLFYGQIKKWAWCIYLLFPIYVYVIYSWFCYNYINGLGSRPMIHIYPLLAIPFAALLLFVLKRNLIVRLLFAALSALLIFVNISYSVKAAEGKLWSERSNMVFNIRTMFKKDLTYADIVVFDTKQSQPDTGKIERVRVLACEDYNDSTSAAYERDENNDTNFVYHLPADQEFQEKKLSVRYDKELFANAGWLKCTGRFKCSEHWGMDYQHLLVLEIRRGDKFIDWRSCKIDNKIGLKEDEHLNLYSFHANTWGEVYFFAKIPEGMRDGDEISINVWNMALKPLFTDYYCIELYQKKP